MANVAERILVANLLKVQEKLLARISSSRDEDDRTSFNKSGVKDEADKARREAKAAFNTNEI